MMLAGKGIIKREISQVLRAFGESVKFLRDCHYGCPHPVR